MLPSRGPLGRAQATNVSGVTPEVVEGMAPNLRGKRLLLGLGTSPAGLDLLLQISQLERVKNVFIQFYPPTWLVRWHLADICVHTYTRTHTYTLAPWALCRNKEEGNMKTFLTKGTSLRVGDSFVEAIIRGFLLPGSCIRRSFMALLFLSSGDTVPLLFSLVWLCIACLSLPCMHVRTSLCSNFLGVRVFVVVFNTTC